MVSQTCRSSLSHVIEARMDHVSDNQPAAKAPRRWGQEIGKRLAVLVLAGLGWLLWNPGTELRDGTHDRRENGLWLAHGWLGGDDWFRKYGKEAEKPAYRSPGALAGLADRLVRHGISDVFPHLCPADGRGGLPAVDPAAVERFLDALPGIRVWPWVGGTLDIADPEDRKWREGFVGNVRALLLSHPRLAGVQLNIEPLPDGSAGYLQLLDQLKAALPEGRRLSVAAYPPPTRWQPSMEVHWSRDYFREVARRCDHLAVMTYDTGIRFPKFYRKLMRDWTREILAWPEGRPVLIGIPAYEDADTTYHKPEVENLRHALAGLHAGLQSFPSLPDSYRGIAVYCDWEMDEAKWAELAERFGRR